MPCRNGRRTGERCIICAKCPALCLTAECTQLPSLGSLCTDLEGRTRKWSECIEMNPNVCDGELRVQGSEGGLGDLEKVSKEDLEPNGGQTKAVESHA